MSSKMLHLAAVAALSLPPLAGCTAASCPVGAAAGACAQPVGAAGAPATGAPQAEPAPAAVARLSGHADLPEGPDVRANVVLLRLGSDAVLSSATSDAQGNFTLDVPADLPANAVLRVVAKGNSATLTAVALPAAAKKSRQVLAYNPVILSLATTLAYASLRPAFATFHDVGGAPSQEALAAIGVALQALIEVSAKTLEGASAEVVSALKQAVQDDGSVSIPPAVAEAVTKNSADFASAYSHASLAIATSIREVVAATGVKLPPAATSTGIGFGTASDAFLSETQVDTTQVVTGAQLPYPGGGSIGGPNDGASILPVEPSLKGTVKVAGVPRQGAQVQIFGPNGFGAKTATAADGSYAFYFLAPGTYTVVIAVNGAQPVTKVVTVS